jgi:prophage regulatory protein
MVTTDRFINKAERKKITGFSDSTSYRMEKKGTFPKRRQISPNRVAWLLSEVMDWVKSREVVDISADVDSISQQDAVRR